MIVGAMSLTWQATALLAGSASSVSDLSVTAAGQATFGGTNDGLQVSVSGTFDQAKGATVMSISHQGGWTPLKGSLGSFFITPAFGGRLTIGGDAGTIGLSAMVTFRSKIALIDGMLVLNSNKSGEAEAGPELHVQGEGDGTEFSYAVNMSAGLQLGDASSGIPKLAVEGLLVSSGTSTYARAHVIPQETAPSSPPVAPSAYSLPDVFPCLMRRSRSSLARAAG